MEVGEGGTFHTEGANYVFKLVQETIHFSFRQRQEPSGKDFLLCLSILWRDAILMNLVRHDTKKNLLINSRTFLCRVRQRHLQASSAVASVNKFVATARELEKQLLLWILYKACSNLIVVILGLHWHSGSLVYHTGNRSYTHTL